MIFFQGGFSRHMQGLKDGVFDGFFKRNGQRMVCEALLAFERDGTDFSFSGEGVDKDGEAFTLKGVCRTDAPYRVEVSRRNADGVRMQGEGFREKNSSNMFGSMAEGKGEFSLRYASVQKSRLREEASARLFGELSEMGFADDAIEAVLAAGLGKTAAIERLTARPAEEERSEGGNEAHQEGVAQLIEMGFDGQMAAEALRAANGNVEQAAGLLMG